jgi:hypothetical protein
VSVNACAITGLEKHKKFLNCDLGAEKKGWSKGYDT